MDLNKQACEIISCKLITRKKWFSSRNQGNFLTVLSENSLQAMPVPSKLPDQLDSSRPELCARLPSCLLPSACCQEPLLPSCPSPSRLLPSASAIRARLELPYAERTSPEELLGSFFFFSLQLIFFWVDCTVNSDPSPFSTLSSPLPIDMFGLLGVLTFSFTL